MEKYAVQIAELACLVVKVNAVSDKRFRLSIDGKNMNLWVYNAKFGMKVVKHFSNHMGTSTGMFIKTAQTYLNREINIYENNKKERKA